MELLKINDWCHNNRLALNIGKTKFIVFQGKRSKKYNLNIKINNKILEAVEKFKFLGLMINSKLTWDDHIRSISGLISRGIGILYRIRNTVPKKTLIIIYNSLILPHITQHLLTWGYNQEKIFRLQKRAIRTIFKARYNAHTTLFFKTAKILKLDDL